MKKVVLALLAALAVLSSLVVAPVQAGAATTRTIVLMRATVDNKPAPTDADLTKMRSVAGQAANFWSSKTGGAIQFAVSPLNPPVYNGNSYTQPGTSLMRKMIDYYGYNYDDASKVFVLLHTDTPALMTAGMPAALPTLDLSVPVQDYVYTAGLIYLGVTELNGSNAVGRFAHELGHMLRLYHSNSLSIAGTNLLEKRSTTLGDSREYGNSWDVMGPSTQILSVPTRELLGNLPLGTKYLTGPPATSTFFDLRTNAIHFRQGYDSVWFYVIPGDGRINAVRVQRDSYITSDGDMAWFQSVYAYQDADVVPALTMGKTYEVGGYKIKPATNGAWISRRYP